MADLKDPRGYAEDFDPAWYLENYINTLNLQGSNRGIMPFALDFLHETFQTGCYKGDKLLDIGTGPTVHPVISASRHVNEIHLSDISPRNRDILEGWLNGDPNVTELFEYFNKREATGMPLEERIQMVRGKVTGIYDVDIRLPDPLPGSSGAYDIVMASLVLSAAARNKEEFENMMEKVITMIKPGGYLIVIDVFGKSDDPWYQVGEFRFSCPNIGREDMKGLFEREDLKLLNWKETEHDYSPKYNSNARSAEEGVFGTVVQKV